MPIRPASRRSFLQWSGAALLVACGERVVEREVEAPRPAVETAP